MKRLHEVVGISARKKKLSEYIQSTSTMDALAKPKPAISDLKYRKRIVPSRHMSFNNPNVLNTPLIKKANIIT